MWALGWHLVQEECKSRIEEEFIEERKRLKIVTWWALTRESSTNIYLVKVCAQVFATTKEWKVIDNNNKESGKWQKVNWKMAKVYTQLKNMDACENYQVKSNFLKDRMLRTGEHLLIIVQLCFLIFVQLCFLIFVQLCRQRRLLTF